MGYQFPISPSWRESHGEQRWLSMLVGAMQQVSQASPQAEPCDSRTLAALRAQLALPATPQSMSAFSLRN